ncbi:hypothetical protein CRENBAI_004109 [Crenichthys baileyi]|uniref:Uncharacterized protein n=1 Tax=Crenichthys baileyi TaxID=28760 RepID=A0AAV9RGH3_9TELE
MNRIRRARGIRRRGQGRLAGLRSLHFTEGVLVPNCGFWLIGFKLFVFKYIWVPELGEGGHRLRARSPCKETLLQHGLKERWSACLPAANDSVSFHQNETQKKSGPEPTEMDNDPCCLLEPEERYTGFILKAHLMRAEEETQAGAKFFLWRS